MSETSSAVSFRWDDTRYAASHALRSYLRSILPHKQWNQEFEVQLLAKVRLEVELGRGAISGRCWYTRKWTWLGDLRVHPPVEIERCAPDHRAKCPLRPSSAANGCSYL